MSTNRPLGEEKSPSYSMGHGAWGVGCRSPHSSRARRPRLVGWPDDFAAGTLFRDDSAARPPHPFRTPAERRPRVTHSLQTLLPAVVRLTERAGHPPLSDGELLRRFTTDGDPAA